MTTYTQEHIEKAYELGRMHERHKVKELASITNASPTGYTVGDAVNVVTATINGRKRAGRPFKKVGTAHKVTSEPKAPVKARGARKAAGPRTKGVKEAIMNLIASGGISASDIIAKTNFKGTSVRATLMSLKKSGEAIQDGDKRWFLAAHAYSGNSGDDTAAIMD